MQPVDSRGEWGKTEQLDNPVHGAISYCLIVLGYPKWYHRQIKMSSPVLLHSPSKNDGKIPFFAQLSRFAPLYRFAPLFSTTGVANEPVLQRLPFSNVLAEPARSLSHLPVGKPLSRN